MGNREAEFRRILKEHLQRYPMMEPEDCAKLIYQSEFAGEHMIASTEKSLEWIKAELEQTQPHEGKLYEDIGCGMARLHFGPAKAAGMEAEEINRQFTASAGKALGTAERQRKKLEMLKEMCAEGEMPFDIDTLEAFLEGYIQRGCPALHHSDAYRQAYEPHYRVVRMPEKEK